MQILKAAIIGAVTAAAVDYHAFQQFQSLDDVKKYNWFVAGKRVLLGAVSGVATSFGLGGVL